MVKRRPHPTLFPKVGWGRAWLVHDEGTDSITSGLSLLHLQRPCVNRLFGGAVQFALIVVAAGLLLRRSLSSPSLPRRTGCARYPTDPEPDADRKLLEPGDGTTVRGFGYGNRSP